MTNLYAYAAHVVFLQRSGINNDILTNAGPKWAASFAVFILEDVDKNHQLADNTLSWLLNDNDHVVYDIIERYLLQHKTD